jgi:hypothetical protein
MAQNCSASSQKETGTNGKTDCFLEFVQAPTNNGEHQKQVGSDPNKINFDDLLRNPKLPAPSAPAAQNAWGGFVSPPNTNGWYGVPQNNQYNFVAQ